MAIEKIIDSLKREFAVNDDGKRKIVFWNDYDKEFEDVIDHIEIEDVSIHKLTEKNNFYTKYLIEEELRDKNILIYNTVKVDDERNNWMLDTMLYSKQFYADKTSLLMVELRINNSLRNEFSKYKSYFGAAERRSKFLRYDLDIYTVHDLEVGILSSITGAKEIDIEEVLKIILIEGLDEEDNKYYQSFCKFGMEEVFWRYIKSKYGYHQENRSLKKLYIHIVSSALAMDIDEEKLSKIRGFIGDSKPNCKLFINHWMMHRVDYIKYNELADVYEEETNIAEVINELNIEEYKDIKLLKCFDRAIIKSIVVSLENRLEDYDNYIDIIKDRRITHFYNEYSNVYEALINAIEMLKFYKRFSYGLPQGTTGKLFNDYISDFYNMDTFYRRFYYYFNKQSTNALKNLEDSIENLYCNWYLSDICTNFTQSITEDMKKEWIIPNVINQRDFYKTHVKPMISDGDRVFVIISDALRYEVGVELTKRLNEKVINSTTISSMLSVVPSITSVGMAALLPNNTINLKDNGKVLVNDMDTSGLENRNKILNSMVENSIALDYNKLPNNAIDIMESVKGYNLVYIYHDTIDAISDKGATEINTFKAVNDAIEELVELINKIRGRGATNILITSDHGFVYQRSELKESDKINKENIEAICKNRRCIVSKENINNDELLKVKMSYLSNSEDIYAYMPKANIRFKVQGEGNKFVHGGATLQEVVVPVVSFKNIRSTSKKSIKSKKVEVKFTNESRKITNESFMLNFFQTEKIDERIKAASISLYMIDDDNKIISEKKTIIADSNSAKPEERVIRTKMQLKPMNYDRNRIYTLIMKDSDTDIIIDEIPFTISLGIPSDFDF